MPHEPTSFESCLTRSLRRIGFQVSGVTLELSQHPSAFPCVVRLRRGTARIVAPTEVGRHVRETLDAMGYGLAKGQAVVVERRSDRYRVQFMLFENPLPFTQPSCIRFRQGRLWRWDGKTIQMISAWPDIEGRIKQAGQAWQQGCPELPRNFLTLKMPQLLQDELEDCGLDGTEDSGIDEYGPLNAAEQSRRAVVYGREERRAGEGFASPNEAEAAYTFCQLIPTTYLKLARRFREENFAILQGLSHTRGMADLIRSNAALAMLLARPDQFGLGDEEGRLESQQRLMAGRRRDALTELGFPGTSAAEHALRKIPASEVNLLNLKQLQAILADEAGCLTLAHLPELRKIQVRFLLEGWGILSASAWRAILLAKSDTQLRKLLRLIKDCRQMSEQLGDDWPPLRPFDGMRSLRRHHDRLIENVYNREWFPHLDNPFPKPPLPAGRGIAPITSGLELMAEGKEMNHCVVSRIDEVLAGDLFVYKVTAPQRATLAVALTASTDAPGRACWTFQELQGPGNRDVRPETFRHVTRWLTECGRR